MHFNEWKSLHSILIPIPLNFVCLSLSPAERKLAFHIQIYIRILSVSHLMGLAPFQAPSHYLTHWGRVTHICVSKLTIIGSDNGLSAGRRQAIIWTNAGILLIGPLGRNVSEILIAIYTFSLKKMHLKMSGKWQPFCLGLNVLNQCWLGCLMPDGVTKPQRVNFVLVSTSRMTVTLIP